MLVKLTNKAIMDLENIAFILQVNINEYIAVPKKTIVPQVPKMDGHEYDELVETLKEHKLLIEVKQLPRLINDSK